MRLSEWLEREGVSDAAFGRRIGVRSRMTVRRYRTGQQRPEPAMMVAIYRETGGAVTPNDFYDLPLTDREEAA